MRLQGPSVTAITSSPDRNSHEVSPGRAVTNYCRIYLRFSSHIIFHLLVAIVLLLSNGSLFTHCEDGGRDHHHAEPQRGEVEFTGTMEGMFCAWSWYDLRWYVIKSHIVVDLSLASDRHCKSGDAHEGHGPLMALRHSRRPSGG